MTKFHNEEVMTEAVQAWMKSDVGQETIHRVTKEKRGYSKFETINVGQDIGYGFQSLPTGDLQMIDKLTNVRVGIASDGEGGFTLFSAFPTK